MLGFERLGLEPLPSHAAGGGGGGGGGPQGPAALKHFAPMVLEGYAWSPPVSASASAVISREKRSSVGVCASDTLPQFGEVLCSASARHVMCHVAVR